MKRQLFATALAALFLIRFSHAEALRLSYQDAATEAMVKSLKLRKKRDFLNALYERILFVPVWTNEKGLSRYGKALFETIENDKTLEPEMKLYQDAKRLKELAQSIDANSSLADKVALEFKISQLYEGYADYSIYGSINWGAFLARLWNKKTEDVHADWIIEKPKMSPIDVVEETLLGGSFKKAFARALPHRYRYDKLQEALAHYIEIKKKGGWATVHLEHTKKLEPGMRDSGVPELKRRLAATGDYAITADENLSDTRYSKRLVKAVRHFQKRNGLLVDGIIGAGTLRELNRSVQDRILTLRLNLDRLKWLRDPPKEGAHVVINIPDFMLYYEEDGKLLEKIPVIVGKRDHPTPIFSDTVEAIVLNPYWNIPRRIIQNEIIPKLLRNPSYLKRKNIKVFSGWGKDAAEVDPATVDWSRYRYSEHVPYRFAQLPGKHNALGRVKFLFPNEFSVYMHDTPAKSLFGRSVRAFSHGCIRLGKPIELLKTFAKLEPDFDFKKAQTLLKSKEKRYLPLKVKVPVDIVYLTAFIDYDGTLQFRRDIYLYDKMQLKAYRRW